MKNLLVNNSFKLIFGIIFFLISCIEDNITPPLTGDLNPVAEMLVYFESNGDFPNSYLAPALIDAEEVFANLNSFLIIRYPISMLNIHQDISRMLVNVRC